jgi:hypothetical protein
MLLRYEPGLPTILRFPDRRQQTILFQINDDASMIHAVANRFSRQF